MNRKPTIKDVAREAGVSTATVVRALKNQGRISKSTQERILQAVKALGYQTNDVAKALQKGKLYTILAVYHTIPEYFTEDFRKGFQAAEANLRPRGLVLKTLRTKSLEPRFAVEALRTVEPKSVDAVVIDCGGPELDEQVQRFAAAGVPVATFGSDSVSSGRAFYVGEDPFVSGQVAGEIAGRLLGAPADVVVFQGPASVDALNRRTAGFCDMLGKVLPEAGSVQFFDHNDEDLSAIRAAIRILNTQKRPACVFCNSAGGTMALYRAIQYLDLKPEEVPVIIGYDFNEEICRMIQEGYCAMTIYQNPYQQAYDVLNYMFEYITMDRIPPNALNYVPCDLIFRSNAHMFMREPVREGGQRPGE